MAYIVVSSYDEKFASNNKLTFLTTGLMFCVTCDAVIENQALEIKIKFKRF